MTEGDKNIESLAAEAARKGKEVEELEKRNARRRAKGRKPLKTDQEKKDDEVLRTRYRSGYGRTVDGNTALRMFEERRAEILAGESFEDDEEEDEQVDDNKSKNHPVQTVDSSDKAVREAAIARNIQDMKNGRIDHSGLWSVSGQKIEGGDGTVLVDKDDVRRVVSGDPDPGADSSPAPKEGTSDIHFESFDTFVKDLYRRLSVSFEEIDRTLSDLQGRVAEIVTATTPTDGPEEKYEEESDYSKFVELMNSKTSVTFDVGGTKMSYDAVTVFHAPPCITVVSRNGSANIQPRPGARLKLTYTMDGKTYKDDPVTFLGTRFELPMFGLSFVGFIRDIESDMMDVGYEEAQQ